METSRIAELLAPSLAEGDLPELALSSGCLNKFKSYLDLLLRWNAKTNLTAVRDPDDIVTRHFGESLFLARVLLAEGTAQPERVSRAADLGSGAGFPGLPLKIACPWIDCTLIESQNKKATFLREVIRGLALNKIDVFLGRGETLAVQLQNNQTSSLPGAGPVGPGFDLVTFRAVEKFDDTLATAIQLLRPAGSLGILIGAGQREAAANQHPDLRWLDPVPLPGSNVRIVQLAIRQTQVS